MRGRDHHTGQGLGPLRLIGFSITGLAIGGAGMPLAVYLPPFYAQTLGLNLALVGAIFMISRLWNALSDPVIGALSDRTQTRFGRRKPWIAGGGVIFAVSALAVFMPGAYASAWYLTFWLFALYLGWSMVSTPLYAWSGDLSGEYHQRTRIQTYLQTMGAMGLVLVLLIPTVLERLRDPAPAHKIALMGWFVVLALGAGIPTLILFFREQPPRHQGQTAGSIAALWPVIANPLVLRVIGSDFFVALGQGFRGALFVFFVSIYMGLPQWTGLLFLIQFVFGVFAAPIWMWIGVRLGKHRTVALGEVSQIAINLSLLLLSPGQLWPLVALTVAQGLSQGSGNLMLRAIVADVADLHRLETGEERSGFLFSIFNVTTNAAMAVALGIAFPILGWLGFTPAGHNSPAALHSLHLFFAIGPALGHTVSALLIWRFPLDETRHVEIARALRAANPSTKTIARDHIPVTSAKTGSWTGRSTHPFSRSRQELFPEIVK